MLTLIICMYITHSCSVLVTEYGWETNIHVPASGSVTFSFAAFRPGTGPIWLDDVQCVGDEDSIFECPSRPPGEHNCVHFEDASVECLRMYTAV